MLRHVLANAPRNYVYQHEEGNSLIIKFWDESEFLHYAAWQREHGSDRPLVCPISAYPRAWYYLGFLMVKLGRFVEALEFLAQGREMEPTNPKFALEAGHALLRAGQLPEALEMYASIKEPSPHVGAADVARAHRGQGAVLLERSDWDGAEQAFLESLRWEPKSEVALNELMYIAHRRKGGAEAAFDPVMMSPNPRECAVCGHSVSDGFVVNVEGRTLLICNGCSETLGRPARKKKWWQFWG